MTLHFLPCGHWAADVRLNLGSGFETTFRVTSARREWAMAMAMARVSAILKQLSC
jgi:hypothetical protein